MTMFSTLHPDGSLTDVRTMEQSRFGECPFFIMVPEHYRGNEGCLCSNKAHRRMMMREWEYTAKDFKGIPLID